MAERAIQLGPEVLQVLQGSEQDLPDVLGVAVVGRAGHRRRACVSPPPARAYAGWEGFRSAANSDASGEGEEGPKWTFAR